MLGSRLDIINEDRINKIERKCVANSELVHEAICELACALASELRRRGRSVREGSIIQLLDWLADIVALGSQTGMSVNEISLMVRSDDSDTLDYL